VYKYWEYDRFYDVKLPWWLTIGAPRVTWFKFVFTPATYLLRASYAKSTVPLCFPVQIKCVHHIQKLEWLLTAHLCILHTRICVSSNCSVHHSSLKVHCHSVSLGNLYQEFIIQERVSNCAMGYQKCPQASLKWLSGYYSKFLLMIQVLIEHGEKEIV